MYSPQQFDPEKSNVCIWSAHNLEEVRNQILFFCSDCWCIGLVVLGVLRCFDCWGSVGMLRWCGQCFRFLLIETHGPVLNPILLMGDTLFLPARLPQGFDGYVSY
jgi:hypothetical protein